MIITDLAEFPPAARADVARALQRGDVAGAASSNGEVSARSALAAAFNRWIEAKPGQVGELARRRLIEAADALGAVWFLGFPHDPGAEAYDLLSDQEVAGAIGISLLNEATAVTEGGAPAVAELVGRRLQGLGPIGWRWLVVQALRLRDAGVEARDRDYDREASQLAEDTHPDLDIEMFGYEVPSRAERLGAWLASTIYDAERFLTEARPDRVDQPVSTAISPVSEFLTALLVAEPDAGPRPLDAPVRQPLPASSPRTRSRVARSARVVAASALAVVAYCGRPEPLVVETPKRSSL